MWLLLAVIVAVVIAVVGFIVVAVLVIDMLFILSMYFELEIIFHWYAHSAYIHTCIQLTTGRQHTLHTAQALVHAGRTLRNTTTGSQLFIQRAFYILHKAHALR